MGDYIVRAMSADGFVKAAAIRSTEIVRRGAAIQGTTTTATAAFGRALTAASMLGNMQKVEDGTAHAADQGRRPAWGRMLGRIRTAEGNVRGYVQHPGHHACWRSTRASWMSAQPSARTACSP